MMLSLFVYWQVAKSLNEVWRQYEMKHKPACVLNFRLPVGDCDVNVTPDKRETFVKHVRADPFLCKRDIAFTISVLIF